jgi:hypothetical protein
MPLLELAINLYKNMSLLQLPLSFLSLSRPLIATHTSLRDTDRHFVPHFAVTQVRMAAATSNEGSARPSSV